MKSIANFRQKHGKRIAIEQALFWSAVGGVLLIWPALSECVPIEVYVMGGVLLSLANGLAHYMRCPGAE